MLTHAPRRHAHTHTYSHPQRKNQVGKTEYLTIIISSSHIFIITHIYTWIDSQLGINLFTCFLFCSTGAAFDGAFRLRRDAQWHCTPHAHPHHHNISPPHTHLLVYTYLYIYSHLPLAKDYPLQFVSTTHFFRSAMVPGPLGSTRWSVRRRKINRIHICTLYRPWCSEVGDSEPTTHIFPYPSAGVVSGVRSVACWLSATTHDLFQTAPPELGARIDKLESLTRKWMCHQRGYGWTYK